MTSSAASLPESVTSGTPPPGWVLPPAKYSPLNSERLCGRLNGAKRSLNETPYSAPRHAPVFFQSRGREQPLHTNPSARLQAEGLQPVEQQRGHPFRILKPLRDALPGRAGASAITNQFSQPAGA